MTTADTDRAILLVEGLAVVAAAQWARDDHYLVGLVVILLCAAALVVIRFLDQSHRESYVTRKRFCRPPDPHVRDIYAQYAGHLPDPVINKLSHLPSSPTSRTPWANPT